MISLIKMVKFIGIPKTIMALALKSHPLIVVVVYQGGKHVCCSIDPAMAPLLGRLITEHRLASGSNCWVTYGNLIEIITETKIV